MDLAGSYRALDMNEKATSTYRTALSYDRRPELYFNLGQTLLTMGQKQAGIQNLITACLYDPVYYDEISQEQLEVKSAVRAYLVAHTKRY
jgi:Tfp pilus assembly protein PilF